MSSFYVIVGALKITSNLKIIYLAILIVLSLGSAKASIYSDLIVFGDSLSDVGNTQYTTSTGFAGFFVSDTPGNAYFEGRFSNGWVWSDWASSLLTPDDPLTPQRVGGDNFAFGGARTEGTDFLTDIYIDDLATQINTFVDTRTGDPEALYTIFIGANDFFQDGENRPIDQIDFTTPAQRVGEALQSLYATGARNFLLFNLPWLGVTPSYGGSLEADEWNTLSQNYNSELLAQADEFELLNSEAIVYELDTAALLNDLIENADERGFTNTTDAAAPGLEAGDNSYDLGQIALNPDEYLFYDGVHPTSRVHELLGYAAVRAVLPTGDCNLDGQVDLDDYNLWTTSYGSMDALEADGNGDGLVDAADYTIWRDSYELLNATTYLFDAEAVKFEKSFLTTSSTMTVPEPSTYLLAFTVIVASISCRLRNTK